MSSMIDKEKLWNETPLLRSSYISERLGCSAYLKLETFHPSQSFKYRGLSLLARRCKEKYGPSLHLLIASSGNAGLATACAAKTLGVRCTVYIPDEATTKTTYAVLKNHGAEVVIWGKNYAEALAKAREAEALDANAVMLSAYDDPIVWEGHSSMITEMATELPCKPDAIFCSVGGGGLLGGVIKGCQACGWDDVPLVALETNGSNCFYQSIAINPGQFNSEKELPDGVRAVYDSEYGVTLAQLARLRSRALSLGASTPAAGVVKMALDHKGGVRCVTVPDELSMQAALGFADEHKLLVELACSTTLTPAYYPGLFNKILPQRESRERTMTVVFIVCGGFKISLKDMQDYESIVRAGLEDGTIRESLVWCQGESYSAQDLK